MKVYNIKDKTVVEDERDLTGQKVAIKTEVDTIMAGDCACMFAPGVVFFVDNATGDLILDTATQTQKDDIKAYLDGLV